MALKEIILHILAIGRMIQIIIETVFNLPHQEVTRIDLTINTYLWVRHHLLSINYISSIHHHKIILSSKSQYFNIVYLFDGDENYY